MNQKSFNMWAGLIFIIVAAVHLWRALSGADLMIGTTMVPVWCSWVAVIIAGILGYNGLKKR